MRRHCPEINPIVAADTARHVDSDGEWSALRQPGKIFYQCIAKRPRQTCPEQRIDKDGSIVSVFQRFDWACPRLARCP